MHDREPPRLPLAHLPTPVVELNRLAESLGVDRILMKRDDFTGLELSGNKIRKLEYVIADARRQDADTLVTHGGYQSNHCRATAAAGAQLGMRVRLILRAPADDQLEPPSDGNLFLDRLFGADISMHPPEQYNVDRDRLVDEALEAEKRAGHRPYFFPVGASVPLGSWGYIRCIAELIEQIGRDKDVDVYAPISSAGTMAGCVLGRALFLCDRWRIVGVPVSDNVETLRRDVDRLVRDTIDDFALRLRPEACTYDVLGDFIGEGYAIPSAESLDAIRRLATLEAVLLDPTYTSKVMAAMIHALRHGDQRRGATPVFLHTGGVFGLMARRELFSMKGDV